MFIRYKQKCSRCKKNYVIVTSRQKSIVCYNCQKKDMEREIKVPEMKKLFDIPEEYYSENSFLRNIKICYLRFGKLTEKQAEAFKKTVKKLKEEKVLESRE